MKRKEKGIASIEALIALLAFAGLLALSISSQQLMLSESSENSQAFTSRVLAFKCAAIADSMFSNSILEIQGEKFECFAGERKASAGMEKEEIETIAKIQQVQSEKSILEVELSEHYK